MKDRVQELQTIAPTVWKFLGAAVSPNLDLVDLDSRAGAHAVMGAAILLKARNQRMCALQSVISVVLYNSGAKKRAYKRLNQMGMCLSHKATLIGMY